MSIEFPCSGCARNLQVAEDQVGRRAICPECRVLTTVPANSVAANSVAANSVPLVADEPAAGEPVADEPVGDGPTSNGQPSAGPTEMRERQWSLRTPGGHRYGPVSRSELEAWISEGRVTGDCELLAFDGVWRKAEVLYPCLAEARAWKFSPGASGPSGSPAAAPPSERVAGRDEEGRRELASAPFMPDRGVLILCLGILGVLVCPIFSVAVWTMATNDLNDMRAGRMDRRGYGLTQAGRIVAILHLMILLVVAVVALFAGLITVGMQAGV